MVTIARLTGFFITMAGLMISLSPDVFKTMIDFWRKDNRIYLAGVLRLVFGAIFVMAAPACRAPVVVSIVGYLVIFGGILVFLIGRTRIHAILNWWAEKPPRVMRLVGIAALTLGILVLHSA